MKQSCCRFHWEPLCFMMCVSPQVSCFAFSDLLAAGMPFRHTKLMHFSSTEVLSNFNCVIVFSSCCFVWLCFVVILLTTEWLQWLHCDYCLLENFVEWQRQAAEPIAYHCAWVSAHRISSNPGALKTGRFYRCCCATAWISAPAALTLRSFVLIWTLLIAFCGLFAIVWNCWIQGLHRSNYIQFPADSLASNDCQVLWCRISEATPERAAVWLLVGGRAEPTWIISFLLCADWRDFQACRSCTFNAELQENATRADAVRAVPKCRWPVSSSKSQASLHHQHTIEQQDAMKHSNCKMIWSSHCGFATNVFGVAFGYRKSGKSAGHRKVLSTAWGGEMPMLHA